MREKVDLREWRSGSPILDGLWRGSVSVKGRAFGGTAV